MTKIFFSLKPPEGSYGGGGFFVKNLVSYLTNKNYTITYKLDEDIDILFIIDPRKGPNKKYGLNDFIIYKKLHPNTQIIYRVNECDIKRDVSINIEPLLVKTIKFADHVVFISKWLQDYFIDKYKLTLTNYRYILNGCNPAFFFPISSTKDLSKIRLVTHHWSYNYLKGFDIYNKLDTLIREKHIEFTFIGQYNKKYKPKNINYIKPKHEMELSNIIREHNIYLTASQNEPCGNHHIEGISCGLPILYCKGGGGIKESCGGVGEEFEDINDLFIKLEKIVNNYDSYVKNIDYNFLSSDRCCKQYINLIQDI
jgi:glycosyltransferase involved in cell wall biosynthesis